MNTNRMNEAIANASAERPLPSAVVLRGLQS